MTQIGRLLVLLFCLSLSTPAASFERATASWYGPQEHGRTMANGQQFDQWAFTAAHRTLPLGTKIRIRNPANGAVVFVTITDRGPYIRGRTLDLSRAAARALKIEERGVAVVEFTIVAHPRTRRT